MHGDRWRLGPALLLVLSRVASYLERQRQRGRSSATDPISGYAIEPGEAEGLIAELTEVFGGDGHGQLQLPIDRAAVGEHPIARVVRAFELTSSELDAVMLALAVELDARFARLVAYVNDHVARTRPTLGLAYAIEGGSVVSPALLQRPFVRDGLVELEGDGPLSGLSIKLARAMLARLGTEHGAPDVAGVRVTHEPADRLAALVLAPETRALLARWSELRDRPLLVAGGPGVGRATCARAALGAAGLPAIEVTIEDPDDLARAVLAGRREARWHRGGLILRLGPSWPLSSTAQAALWASVIGLQQPVAITTQAAAVEAVAEGAPVEPLIVSLAPPALAARVQLWQRMLPPAALTADEIDLLAARFELTPKGISRVIRRAEPDGLDAASIQRAAREVGAAQISAIAQRLPLVHARADLVLPPKLLAELDLAIAWLRHKRHVYETWGFGQRIALGRGLTALFAGPPGTGKTMTAQVLASDLALDLYRVDLSRVMSKYIGETEKNLSRLFDEAQASGAVLFFDEADAMFGKRSEVRDAHDRYANVEIGYLLQRMEEHEGAVILATNRLGDLDEAFTRRFHFLLDFPMPDAAHRLRLWEGMLPAQTPRAPDLDLSPLANSYELSGGEIRNCVLAAAYMAAAEGQPVGYAHLERGLRRELNKTGRIVVTPRRRVVHEEV